MKFNTIRATPELINAFDNMSIEDVDFPAYDICIELTPMFNENTRKNSEPAVVQGYAWKTVDLFELTETIQDDNVKSYVQDSTDVNFDWTIAIPDPVNYNIPATEQDVQP